MKAKKQALLERNNRLKENQDKPSRDYSNSVTRHGNSLSNSKAFHESGGSNVKSRMQPNPGLQLTNQKMNTSPTVMVRDEIKEVNGEEEKNSERQE